MAQRPSKFDILLGALISAFDQADLLMFAGLGLLGYGASLVYWPAGFLVPGAILVAVAVFGVRGG
jgi:hypothetical protein